MLVSIRETQCHGRCCCQSNAPLHLNQRLRCRCYPGSRARPHSGDWRARNREDAKKTPETLAVTRTLDRSRRARVAIRACSKLSACPIPERFKSEINYVLPAGIDPRAQQTLNTRLQSRLSVIFLVAVAIYNLARTCQPRQCLRPDCHRSPTM
jgi:hypothetical protein